MDVARRSRAGIRLLAVRARGFLALVLVVAAVPVLSACGERTMHAADANNNGTYINAGPLTYQLQISRELNQYLPSDAGYMIGLPKAALKLSPTQLWFGVFLWAKNETNRIYRTTDNFDLVDTQGNVYRPLKLNPTVNQFAWTAQTLAPGDTEPTPNTTAANGASGGKLLLFKLNASIYDNRPLSLEIRAPSGDRVWATMSLDL